MRFTQDQRPSPGYIRRGGPGRIGSGPYACIVRFDEPPRWYHGSLRKRHSNRVWRASTWLFLTARAIAFLVPTSTT